MGQHTEIQWADGTVNPVAGCGLCELWTKTVKSCYAGQIHTRFQGSKAYPGPFEEITLHPGRMAKAAAWSDLTGTDRLDKPWLNGMPRVVFVSDMSDALSKEVPFEYLLSEIIANVTSTKGSRHIWMWLTKRPCRMAEFAEWLAEQGIAWPKRLWAGTSVTTQATCSRIDDLLKVPAAVRFVSAEPLWEKVDLGLRGNVQSERMLRWHKPIGNSIHLVICGGESGQPTKVHPFDLAWARDLRDQCRDARVKFFLKQYGRRPIDAGQPINLRDSHGGDWDQWSDESLKIREFPDWRNDGC